MGVEKPGVYETEPSQTSSLVCMYVPGTCMEGGMDHGWLDGWMCIQVGTVGMDGWCVHLFSEKC